MPKKRILIIIITVLIIAVGIYWGINCFRIPFESPEKSKESGEDTITLPAIDMIVKWSAVANGKVTYILENSFNLSSGGDMINVKVDENTEFYRLAVNEQTENTELHEISFQNLEKGQSANVVIELRNKEFWASSVTVLPF